ncbi:sirohydrochlorin chelatase [Vampirovibrio sp.]|uniref:sirohydrochlorin chelatase n=1 Tax=Vampirovibrio sp. TaxID=2717857 RepID=UPI00359390D8
MTQATSRLVLLAHGSRDPRWQDTFLRLLSLARQQFGDASLDLAYMEMCSPSLLDVSEQAYNEGIRKLTVLPLFMSAGGHVSQDIPRLADQAMTAFEGLEVQVLPPAGEHPVVMDAFLTVMQESLSGQMSRPV